MRVGILPLGRLTFDVPFAEAQLAAMLEKLDASGAEVIGPRTLLTDMDMGRAAIDALKTADISHLLILQVTFTDADLTVEAVAKLGVPASIWAVPEPRLGGRLRLNAFCGLNLASHALSLNEVSFRWLYADPAQITPDEIRTCLNRAGTSRLAARPAPADTGAGQPIADAIKGRRIAKIGTRPDGFHTCDYDGARLDDLAGVAVDDVSLDRLFETAKSADAAAVASLRGDLDTMLDAAADVDQAELDRSLRLKIALDELKADLKADAFAIRCWPETFTEYGGAVCGPASILGEARTPCACEADVYGALTQMILQEAAQTPVFLADLVDMDIAENTGVVWHCGQAPLSMIDEDIRATATIHTNRKMPLLFEFPLKPGRVTLMRISQSFGEPKMILAKGEMLKRPMAFTGTSGVLRFDTLAQDALPAIMNSGLEHHMALAYGDQSDTLKNVAAALNLPIIEL